MTSYGCTRPDPSLPPMLPSYSIPEKLRAWGFDESTIQAWRDAALRGEEHIVTREEIEAAWARKCSRELCERTATFHDAAGVRYLRRDGRLLRGLRRFTSLTEPEIWRVYA